MRRIIPIILLGLIIGCARPITLPDFRTPAGGPSPVFLIDEIDSMTVVDRDGYPVPDETVRVDNVKIVNTVARAVASPTGSFTWSGDIPPEARLVCLIGIGDAPPGVFNRIGAIPPINRYGGDDIDPREGAKYSLYANGERVIEVQLAPEEMHQWTPITINLADYAGENVTLTLTVEVIIVGTKLPYWGHPEILAHRENPRRVILLGIDTVAAGHVGWMGYDRGTTQILDRIASRSIIFEDAHSSSPWTLPSFATVLSGRPPGVTGADRRNRGLSDHEDMVAENFRRNDFCTAGFVNIPHLQEAGFFQGIDHQWEVHDFPAGRALLKARNWIEYHNDQEFFIFIHLFDPHIPYEPTFKWIERLGDPEYEGQHTTKWDLPGGLVTQNHYDPAVWASFDEAEQRRCMDLYDAEIGTMDDALGGFFGWYEEQGLMDDTLLIVFSDHGEEFGEHGRWEHGHSQYEEQLHVPFFMKLPGQISSRRVDGLVGTIDIYPTLMELFGFTPEIQSFGRSLAPVLEGGTPDADYYVISESTLWGPEIKAIMTNEHKYILNMMTGAEELYDLVNDPDETENIATENTETTDELRAVLEEYVSENESGWHLRFVAGPNLPMSFDISVSSDGTIENPSLEEQIFTGSGEGLTVVDSFNVRVTMDLAAGDTIELRFSTNPETARVVFAGTIDGRTAVSAINLGATGKPLTELLADAGDEGAGMLDDQVEPELALSADDPVVAFSYPEYNREETRGAYLWSIPESLRAHAASLTPEQIEALESVGYLFD